jgi:transcriptional regulator with XRE-family HTH domain
MDFSEWLRTNLNNHHLTQADLSRKSKVSEAHISRLLSGSRVGEEAAIAIAKAFKLPPEEGLRAAGILPKSAGTRKIADDVVSYKLSELSDDQIDEVIQFIEFIQDRDDRDKKKEFLERHTREATQPPERGK